MANYSKIRMFDSDIHIFEYDPKKNPSQIAFGQKGKLERASTLNHGWYDKNGYKAIAKINLGFFWKSSEHLGLVMYDGGFVEGSPSLENAECWLDKEGNFHVAQIDDAKVDQIKKDGFAWGGSLSYSLLVDGEKKFLGQERYDHFAYRHPRTLVGQKTDGTMVLAVADGRSSSSRGLTGKQSADVMLHLGCINAINADGGGSSTMVFDNKVVNKPSDGSERGVGTALLVFAKDEPKEESTNENTGLDIIEDFLTPNPYSRPQRKLSGVDGIVWHWVANPNSSAKGNRNYFESRKNGKNSYGSAHYIIDIDGNIIQCLPDDEMAYHVGSKTYTSESLNRLGSYPNANTIGIECTHIDWEGNMTQATKNALYKLTAHLLDKYSLDVNDIWLHKTVVGWKDCHRFYVNNPAEYKKAKENVFKLMEKNSDVVKDVDPKEFAKSITLVDSDAEGMYEIKSGDTLWGISQALDITVDQIQDLNPDLDPRTLKVGDKIRVKEVKIATHTVVKGDTLWGISSKYNITVDKLRQLNKGIEATVLQVGAKIVVATDEPVETKPEKAVTKPSYTKYDDVMLGRVKGSVWLHSTPDYESSSRSRVLNTGESYKVYGESDNEMYDVGGGYVGKKYIEIVGKYNVYDLPSVVLRRGASGSHVVQLQRALNKLNFIVGKEDGEFGARTENALKRFQSIHTPYSVDGVYGSKTEKALEEQLNK